jgi:hypothetical protein
VGDDAQQACLSEGAREGPGVLQVGWRRMPLRCRHYRSMHQGFEKLQRNPTETILFVEVHCMCISYSTSKTLTKKRFWASQKDEAVGLGTSCCGPIYG